MALSPGVFNLSPDFLFAIRTGRVPGHSIVPVRGHISGLGTASAVLAGSGGGVQAISVAATVQIASTSAADDTAAGEGAKIVRISGLDDGYNEISEDVTMDGSATVTSVKLYQAVNRLVVMSAGTIGVNNGDIHCGAGAFTSGVPASKYHVLERDKGFSWTAAYTVPAKKICIPIQFVANVRDTSKFVQIDTRLIRNAEGVNYNVVPMGFGSEGFVLDMTCDVVLMEKDFMCMAGFVNATTADVTCIMFLVQIDEALFNP